MTIENLSQSIGVRNLSYRFQTTNFTLLSVKILDEVVSC